MLINYLKTSFRAIRKAPMYGLLNIAGLALGIACAALIFLWVEDELQFDHQVPKHNQLYSIRMNIPYGGKIESFTSIPGPMPAAIRGHVPGIVNNTRFGYGRELFGFNDKSAYENGFYVDTSYFSMMQLSFVKGNAKGFEQPHSLVITQEMATKFFGNADPVGKTLRINNQQDFTVLGVVRDPPSNVSMRRGWLAPVSNFLDKNRWLDSWGTYGISTLVELEPGADVNEVNRQLTSILQPKDALYTHANCQLWSMNDWHLYDRFTDGRQDGGQIKYVRLFSTIAWIILIIACINFMNLATARAGQRVREIGVRKTLGALKNSLIAQFIVEALIMSFMAVLLAILLVYLFMPGFNGLVGKELIVDLLAPRHLSVLLAIGVCCGLIAGSYPAFYLSSFHPVAVLKGQRVGLRTGAGFIRKGLVVLQFTISVVLIVCTTIIYQQVQHVKDRDLGYDKNNLVYTFIQGNLITHFDAVRSQLIQTGVVENTALTGSPPLGMWGTTTTDMVTWEGGAPGDMKRIYWESASPPYIATMGLTIKEGRDFSTDIQAESVNVIINETMAKMMGKSGRLGGILMYDRRMTFHVVGIIKDFLYNDMYGAVAPLVLRCERETDENYAVLAIRLKRSKDLPAQLAKVEAIVRANNGGQPFDYQFADQEFDNLFRTETRIGKLTGVFAVLAIFISCLGLFGLAGYTAERRTKELGIRKVLGASVTHLVTLLSKEFLQWVALSCLIAFPLAWWFMHGWLADYAYRTAIHWWVFGMAGVGALVIALLTVSFQAVKAALSDPVETLRSE